MGFAIRYLVYSCTNYFHKYQTKYDSQNYWLILLTRCLYFTAGLIGIVMSIYSIFYAFGFLSAN